MRAREPTVCDCFDSLMVALYPILYNICCFSQKQEKLPQKAHSGDASTAWHELEEGEAGL